MIKTSKLLARLFYSEAHRKSAIIKADYTKYYHVLPELGNSNMLKITFNLLIFRVNF